MITMLIVDDEYLVRQGIMQTIPWETYGIHIIGDASNGSDGLKIALEYQPDIILTDMRMPEVDGIHFMKQLRRQGVDSSIIVLSGFDDFNYAKSALTYGALNYLLKPIDNDELLKTILDVATLVKQKKSTAKYYACMKEEFTNIKKQFLLNLIDGQYKDLHHVKEKIGLFQVPINLNALFLVVITVDDFNLLPTTYTPEEIDQLKKAIENELASILILHPTFMGSVLNREHQWLVIVNPLENKSTEDMPLILESLCSTFLNHASRKFTITFSIGISELCDDIMTLNRIYEHTLLAANDKLIPGRSNISFSKDLHLNAPRKEVKKAMQYIRKNYEQPITVDTVADYLNLSASHLMRIFKDDLGTTLNEYLTQHRINLAKELLKEGQYKIYEVSYHIGYKDVRYFSQIFKKSVGMTPRQYMKHFNVGSPS